MISDEQMNFILAVAKESNINRCAMMCRVSTEYFSSELESLEMDLKMVLLERSGDDCFLTDSGKVLAKRTQGIENMVEDFYTLANELKVSPLDRAS